MTIFTKSSRNAREAMTFVLLRVEGEGKSGIFPLGERFRLGAID
jgi:hypothetical protein